MQEKKAFGYFATLLSALLCLAAGIFYKVVNGYFGLLQSSHKDCYEASVFWLLIAGAAVVVVLFLLKKYGLASAVTTAAAGISILLFVHKCYWYVVDVLYGIDEKQFDPNFIIFIALMAAAFIIGEVAIYTKKTKAPKAAKA